MPHLLQGSCHAPAKHATCQLGQQGAAAQQPSPDLVTKDTCSPGRQLQAGARRLGNPSSLARSGLARLPGARAALSRPGVAARTRPDRRRKRSPSNIEGGGGGGGARRGPSSTFPGPVGTAERGEGGGFQRASSLPPSAAWDCRRGEARSPCARCFV